MMAMISIALSGIFAPVLAQKNYYVVVGAFSTEGNAKEFTTQLPEVYRDTAYAFASEAGVAHMYVLHTTDEELAISKSLELQKSLHVSGNPEHVGNYETVEIRNSNESKETSFSEMTGEVSRRQVYADASSSKASTNVAGSSSPALKSNSKLFRFTVTNDKAQEVQSKIHFVDFNRERELASYATSSSTNIINPGKNPDMALVCGVFGYKINEKHIDYANPSSMEGTYQDESGAWVIPYKLERLEKGDVSVMYNVTFHKDAVVMLPQSQADLDELVSMMKENAGYEITVHGHCNGKNDRKIISLEKPYSLFDITSSKQTYGSAKTLSSLRANAVKDYLKSNGIDEKRIKIYAWGGKDMLADPQGPYSRLNDRIEIEIRKD
jgi:outer membrane protein OmpA-like peptidoglycan-associated protein